MIAPSPDTLSFINLPFDEAARTGVTIGSEITEEDDLTILPDVFLAASENGCIISQNRGHRSMETPWKLSVPHSVATWRFSTEESS